MNRTSPYTDPGRRRGRKLLIAIALTVVVIAAGITVAAVVFSDVLLNRYAKEKIESVFAEAFPGYVLHIGSIHYNFLKNYTECRAVSLAAADSSLLCSAASFAVSEIGWRQLVMRQGITAGVMKQSVLTANDILVRLPAPGYEIHCGGIRISVPDSEITATAAYMDFSESRYHLQCGTLRASAADSEISAEAVVLRPLAGDADFFSVSAFRRTRVSLTIAQCYLRRAPVADLLGGKSLSAGTIDIFEPEIDLLVNREKPSDPHSPRPLMPGEALARLGRPVHLDTLAIHSGRLTYGERLEVNGSPGVITFDSVRVSALGIGNSPRDTITLRGKGEFMKAGVMSVVMTIPMAVRQFSLSYNGSLTAMDCTTLNRFLETAEHTRITSGMLHDASFDVHVERGRASGKLKAVYNDLYITMLDAKTGSKLVLGKQLATFFANLIKIRGTNTPDASGAVRMGAVKYACKPGDTFMNIAWFSLRSSVGDIVGF
jgi:hypothetical protein